jgi:GTP-binding protein YchF
MLKVGIVGLPNVGKSTLFTALTKKQVDCANFPFCTIEPNVGTVEVPDERLQVLADFSKSEKIIGIAIEFVDIAGLVKGASEGEGLGNQFLANIRETDMIAHVVRSFSGEVTHVDGSVDPLRDVEVIETELILADLQTVDKRLERIEKKAIATRDKDLLKEVDLLKKVKSTLESGKLANVLELNEDEEMMIGEWHLITRKKVIYVVNVDEADAIDENWVSPLGGDRVAVPISVKIEADLSVMEKGEAQEFMAELGMKESGLDKVIRLAYQTLGLVTYFTTGEKETRAWTVERDTVAPKAAAKIHTDFEKQFVRAEVVAYADFVECGGEAGAKAVGKLRVVGKDYVVEDGDVCHFLLNK